METIWVTTEGKISHVKPENGTDFSLDELQGYVGGYIEIAWLNDGRAMIVNEEGKLNNLPNNEIATQIYGNPYDHIVGNVLITDRKYIK